MFGYRPGPAAELANRSHPRRDSFSAFGVVVVLGLGALVLPACSGAPVDSTEQSRDGQLRIAKEASDATFEELGLACEIGRSANDEGTVEVWISNDGPHEIRMLSRGTPWDDADRVWSVQRSGAELQYHGVIAFRGEPGPDEFVAASPGETVSVEYDIGEKYALDSRQEITLELRSPNLVVEVSGVQLLARQNCGSFTAELGPHHGVRTRTDPLTYLTSSGFPCSVAEQAKAEHGEALAKRSLLISQKFMNTDNPVFKRCFGNHDAVGLTFVSDQIATMNTLWPTFTADCHASFCASGIWAYVLRPEDVDFIHLCSEYLTPPVEIVRSRAIALTHEKAHLVAGSLDLGNGAAALSLAQSNPMQAILNADNYALFTAYAYEAVVGAQQATAILMQ